THGFPFVREIGKRYLSRLHRDAVAEGCVLPSLASEVSRQTEETRGIFEDCFKEMLDELEPHMPDTPQAGLTRRDRAIAVAALLLGGLILARATKSKSLSDRILLACQRFAVAEEPKHER